MRSLKHCFWLFVLFLLPVLAAPGEASAQTERGRLVGTVVERGTRQPVPGANVLVEGTERGTATGPEGRFELGGIPVGTYVVRVSSVGFQTSYRTDVVVSTGQPAALEVELEAKAVQAEAVTVRPSYFEKPKEVSTSAFSLEAEEVRRAPGALGDVSRVIQTLPSVVPTNDQRNDLVVRGGSPSENRILVDGIALPSISHFSAQGASGGPITMLGSELISEANFLAGGFPAKYGGRLSSVLNVSLREGSRESFGASADLGFAGAGAFLEGPFPGGKGSWIVSGHRSYLDLITGGVGLTATPQFSNYQAKATYDLSERHRFEVLSIGGRDAIHFDVNREDPDDPSLLDITSGGWNTTTGANWRMLLGENAFGTLTVSDSYNTFDQEVFDEQLDGAPLVFRNRSGRGRTTAEYDLTYQTGPGKLNAGVRGTLHRSYLDVEQPHGAPNPYSPERRRREPFFLDDEYYTGTGAAHLQWSRPLTGRLEATLGGRATYYGYDQRARLSPRVGLTYALTPNLNWNASYGIYHQMPSLVYVRAEKENRDLAPLESHHYITGLSYFPRSDVRLSVETYYKQYADYPVARDIPTLSLANTGDETNVAGRLLPYVSEGEGYAAGVEFYLQKKLTDRLYGQVSYSYSRVFHEALNGEENPGSFDLPHVLSVIGGYKILPQLEVSGQFTLTSGRPYTPLKTEVARKQNRLVYDLGRVNEARSPIYHRLDLRADYRFNFDEWSLVTFFEAQNVYDRANVFQYVWNPKTRSRDTVRQISFLPLGGVTVEI